MGVANAVWRALVDDDDVASSVSLSDDGPAIFRDRAPDEMWTGTRAWIVVEAAETEGASWYETRAHVQVSTWSSSGSGVRDTRANAIRKALELKTLTDPDGEIGSLRIWWTGRDDTPDGTVIVNYPRWRTELTFEAQGIRLDIPD